MARSGHEAAPLLRVAAQLRRLRDRPGRPGRGTAGTPRPGGDRPLSPAHGPQICRPGRGGRWAGVACRGPGPGFRRGGQRGAAGHPPGHAPLLPHPDRAGHLRHPRRIPALANERSQDAVRAGVFADCGPLPTEVPACLDRVYAVDEVVRPDLCVPGCPPRPEAIAAAITAVLDDELPATPAKSVCETCPARREGRAATRTARRFPRQRRFRSGRGTDHMRCLLEQGLLCMGPVTAGGCGGSGVPLCVRVRVPCRGCYGPVRAGSNPLLDLMNALAGQGVDRRSVVDRRSLLRFCGGPRAASARGRPALNCCAYHGGVCPGLSPSNP